MLHLVHLLLSEDELLVDVGLEGIVGTDELLTLLVSGTAQGVLLEHVAFLAVYLCELRLEVVDL